MKKIIFSLMLVFIGLTTLQSQTTKSFYLELGGGLTDFQDIKYSNVVYSGMSGIFNIGIERERMNHLWNAGLMITGGKESASTHERGSTIAVNPKFYFRYMRKINDQLAIGGHWDILGLGIRGNRELGNNGIYYLGSSDLLIASTYQIGKFNFGLDLGVLFYIKEGTSFAFSAPQNGLEDGEFNYQNEKLEHPLGFKYYQLRFLTQHLNLRTNITYQLNDRFRITYRWSTRHFSEVKNYPVTMGSHHVSIRWNLKHKVKEATSDL